MRRGLVVLLTLVAASAAPASAADLSVMPAAPFVSGTVAHAGLGTGHVKVLLDPVGTALEHRRGTLKALAVVPIDAAGAFTWTTAVTPPIQRALNAGHGWLNVQLIAVQNGRSSLTYATRRAEVADGRLQWAGAAAPVTVDLSPGAPQVARVRPSAMTAQGGGTDCRYVADPRYVKYQPTLVGEIHSARGITSTFTYGVDNTADTTTQAAGISGDVKAFSIIAGSSVHVTTLVGGTYSAKAENGERFYLKMRTRWRAIRQKGPECSEWDTPRVVTRPAEVVGPIRRRKTDLNGTSIPKGLDGDCPPYEDAVHMNTYSLSNGTALTRSSSRAELFTSGVKVSFAGVPIFDSTSTSGYSHAVQQTWEANGSVKKRKRLWLCSADGSPILDGPNAGAVVYAGSRPD